MNARMLRDHVSFGLGRGLLAAAIVLSVGGCDEPAKTDGGAAPSATVAAVKAAPTATAEAAPTASAKPMPPRPLPLGEAGPIQPSDPPDKQMMTIGYTLAMLAPRPTDPPTVDKAYIERILKDIAPIARANGAKGSEPAKAAKGDRKIEVEVASCTETVPKQLITGAKSSLEEAHKAGVLVISCQGNKWECHHSTRDPKDILCHAAPRR